jgi:hypothetical protein
VLNAGRNAKFHSSLTQADLFTAENAGRRKETHEEDTRLSLSLTRTIYFSIFIVSENLSECNTALGEQNQNIAWRGEQSDYTAQKQFRGLNISYNDLENGNLQRADKFCYGSG